MYIYIHIYIYTIYTHSEWQNQIISSLSLKQRVHDDMTITDTCTVSLQNDTIRDGQMPMLYSNTSHIKYNYIWLLLHQVVPPYQRTSIQTICKWHEIRHAELAYTIILYTVMPWSTSNQLSVFSLFSAAQQPSRPSSQCLIHKNSAIILLIADFCQMSIH